MKGHRDERSENAVAVFQGTEEGVSRWATTATLRRKQFNNIGLRVTALPLFGVDEQGEQN